jgi:4-hydroxy-tetrahydrodipicolinate synthase
MLANLCTKIEYVQYVKEETIPSTIKLTKLLNLNDGSCLGVFGGAGGRYLIEEFRRGSAGNMPGCHVTDVVVAFWNALETGNENKAMEIYKALAPLFFFEHQLSGCYKEVLYRRGIIDCPLKRNGPMPLDEISSKYLDEILASLEQYMSWGI